MIARLKEQVDKLGAAETFSRQSESERRRFESEAKRLKDANDRLGEELNQEKAKVSARDLKIMQIEEGSAALADERVAELLRGMAAEAESLGGGWSKARVVEFITGHIYEIEEEQPCANTARESREGHCRPTTPSSM